MNLNYFATLQAAASLTCCMAVSGAYAVEAPDEKTWLTIGQAVSVAQLDQVRGGTHGAADVAPSTVGVILWDEPRLPPPPVRNTTVDVRVTGGMNVFHK